MGNTSSKQAASKPTYISSRPASEDDELVLKLQNMLVRDSEQQPSAASSDGSNPISVANLYRWRDLLLANPKNELALNVLTNNEIASVVAQPSRIHKSNQNLFNVTVKYAGHPVTNQKSSGRCWLFASTNVFKEYVKANYNLEDFELSQNYLYFYDKLEKCNWFLNRILDSADADLDSRLVQFLLAMPENDGGQWDMVVNLVTRYGLVPKTVYTDSVSSLSSNKLNYIVNEKLREYALILRKMKHDAAEKNAESAIELTKETMMQEIFNVLSLTLGIPPKPDQAFTWEYKDKDGKFNSIESTPLDFYKNIVKFKADEHFSLIHDPRNVEGLYTVDQLGNIEGGKPIEYVNTSIDNLKKAAIAMLKDDKPVFFGSDVGKFEDTNIGLLDTGAWNFKLSLGTGLNMSKKQRLMTGSSQMTHAMVLTGVHIVEGKPVRWRVENSWGEYGEHKGYFVMSDRWFDEYVFQVVTNATFADPKCTEYWKAKEYMVLPYYDPMGSLA